MDPTSMRLYTARLSKENSTDVVAVLQKLAEMPRAEFETAVPDIATITAMIRAEEIARKNRSTAQKSQRLVRYVCPSCGATRCAFPGITEDLFRKCYRVVGFDERGAKLECGYELTVIFDENQEPDGERVYYKAPAFVEKALKETPRVLPEVL